MVIKTELMGTLDYEATHRDYFPSLNCIVAEATSFIQTKELNLLIPVAWTGTVDYFYFVEIETHSSAPQALKAFKLFGGSESTYSITP